MKYRLIPLALAALLALGACQNVKYADRYGFLPGNDALANSEAFQRCLDGGGRINYKVIDGVRIDLDPEFLAQQGDNSMDRSRTEQW